jgi:hypothetical protein
MATHDDSLSDDISASSLEVESAINFEEDSDHLLNNVVGDFPVGLYLYVTISVIIIMITSTWTSVKVIVLV